MAFEELGFSKTSTSEWPADSKCPNSPSRCSWVLASEPAVIILLPEISETKLSSAQLAPVYLIDEKKYLWRSKCVLDIFITLCMMVFSSR